MADLARLAELVRNVADERALAGRHLETLRQSRDALETAPLPKSDLVARIEGYIDAQLERFDANVERTLARILHRPNIDFAGMPGGFPFLQPLDGFGLDEQLIVAVLAAALKKRVRDVVARMEWPEAGPPASERDARRAALDAEIEAAEAALTTINAQLAAAGVTVGDT